MALADRIVGELGIEWFFNIQLVGDHVIEINPRISTVVYQEDLNLPYLGVKRALGEISDDELEALRPRVIRPGRTALATSTSSSGASPRRPRGRRDPHGSSSASSTARQHRGCAVDERAGAFARRGIDAQLVVFNRYTLHPEADRSLDLAGGLVRRQLAHSGRPLAELLPRTDLFHFTFGLTLVPQSLQFPILRAFGKRSVMHYLGSDIRGKPPEELAYGKKAGAEIVGSYDAIRWVPEATVIPPGIDLAAVTPSPPSGRRRPVVVHAPSSRRRKGTDHVLRACEGLDVELRIVEGVHHDEALALYRDADIVVDQLNAGWYGLFAIECMALGKPVLTFLHDEAVRRTEDAYGVQVPIVNTTHDTLHERLAELVAMAPSERNEIGRASRAYVESVHDLEHVTDRLVELYDTVLERAGARRTHGRGGARAPRRSGARGRRPRDRPTRGAGRARGGAGGGRARSPAQAARPPLGDLRDRRPRLARHRRAPAADLHALPDPCRLREDRDAPRPHHRDGADPPRRHHERVLPLLLRRRRRRGTTPCPPHVVLVHDGRRDARAPAAARARGSRLEPPVRHRRRREPRPRLGRRVCGRPSTTSS